MYLKLTLSTSWSTTIYNKPKEGSIIDMCDQSKQLINLAVSGRTNLFCFSKEFFQHRIPSKDSIEMSLSSSVSKADVALICNCISSVYFYRRSTSLPPPDMFIPLSFCSFPSVAFVSRQGYDEYPTDCCHGDS